MRNIRLTIKIGALLLASVLAVEVQAAERAVERTYVSTDRTVYVAGDMVWCSVFCRDLSTGRPSGLSSVVYLELHSPEGMVQSAKIALVDGRGAGSFTLQQSLPTGNYKLVAYTAQNMNEKDYDYECVSPKILSVFNAFTCDRVKDGVEMVDDGTYSRMASSSSGSLPAEGLRVTSDGRIEIDGLDGKDASVSVSVFHDDGIVQTSNATISDFARLVRKPVKAEFVNRRLPDFEGEVIEARIAGFNPEMIPQLIGKYAFISAPGNKSDIYSAPISEDGRIRFITGNIYSDKEMMTEIEGIDSNLPVHVELVSPFSAPVLPAAPKLVMAPSIAPALTARAAAMQIEKRFAADTLYSFLPIRDNLLFDGKCIQYVLDDYTRFPTMQEDIVEFITQLRVRKRENGKSDIQVRLANDHNNYDYSRASSLMMLDGVPVFDQEKILGYDPLLVESVNIYPYTYFVGSRLYDGIVNFVTYKKTLPSMKFGDSARVVDFQGVSYPAAYTCASLESGGGYPDYRQTIYWHPLVNVPAGRQVSLDFVAPSYGGRFTVVVEGLTPDGESIFRALSFELK